MTRQSRQFSGQGRSAERNEPIRNVSERSREGERTFGMRDERSFGSREDRDDFASASMPYGAYPRYDRDERSERDDENARFGRGEGRFDQAWSRGRDDDMPGREWQGREWQARDLGERGQGRGLGGGMGYGGSMGGSFSSSRNLGMSSQSGYGQGNYSHGPHGQSASGMTGRSGTSGGSGRGDWFQDDRFGDTQITQNMNRSLGGRIGADWHGQGSEPGGQNVAYGELRGNTMGGWEHASSGGLQSSGMGGTSTGYGGSTGYGVASGGLDRPHIGKGPRGYTRSDERIREDVCDYLSDGYVDASNVEVEVRGGVVTLTGTVAEKQMKRQIEDLVEVCRGVKSVENQIRVQRQAMSGQSFSAQGQGTSSTGGTSSSLQGNNGEREESHRGKNPRSSAS